ncbi:MAG TPA: hypothetical protein VF733_02890 [Candidatus Saccharimonadales bacterium]
MDSFGVLLIIAVGTATLFIACSVRIYNQISRGERKLRHTRSESTTGIFGGWDGGDSGGCDSGGGGDGGSCS